MTEIPEHLLKRAEQAKARAAAAAEAAANAPAEAAESVAEAAAESVAKAGVESVAEAAPASPAQAPAELTPEQQAAASRIPPHLLERAKAARTKSTSQASDEAAATAATAVPAASAASAGAEQPAELSAEQQAAASKIPQHLLDRAKAARTKSSGDAGGAVAVATAATATSAVAAATVPAGNTPTGPGGHTQRLLTVVKSGSIQDIKSVPQDKVHVWPHLLVVEFVAALAVTAFTLIFSIFVNAPLLELADFNATPNPSKAPWYFLGLQELLTMFHPMVAGVTLPGWALILLILAPYIDKNPSNKPEKRKFAISLMTVHLMFWAVLVMIGSFFRGPGFNFVFPWEAGLFFEL